MSENKENQIPKDQEEAEKFYGDEHNNQHKNEHMDKVKHEDVENHESDRKNRSNSNVLTHPRDKDDESFDVKHNEKKRSEKP
jgi:hypothetical protein